MNRRGWIASSVLLVTVFLVAVGLAAWKHFTLRAADAAAANQPEAAESIQAAMAVQRDHRHTTTSIGTVLALRSITVRNEIPGTVRQVALAPGQVVEAGTLLVALDVSVEEAELQAHQAQVALAEALLTRMRQMSKSQVASDTELDRARAERDVARAQTARVKAVIARKTIAAPFRARVGISDVHPGQYLEEGTLLTTLQSVDDAAHVDFWVAQSVAAGLREGDAVEVFAAGAGPDTGGTETRGTETGGTETGGAETRRTDAVETHAATGDVMAIPATVVAVDARVDPATRNAMVRARIEGVARSPAPGASVRVRVPVGPRVTALAVPASAVRKGPEGDHVFVIAPDDAGNTRAKLRRVEAGSLVGDEVLIHAGLAAGERVAASGSFKLRDAGLVAVAADPAAQPVAAEAVGAARVEGVAGTN